MFKRVRRFALFVGTVVAASALVTQPALAFKQTGHTGTTGAHSVVDTNVGQNQDVTCTYVQASGIYKLVHIWVFPPKMKAVPGMGNEKLGWQFTVQRNINGAGWTNRYTSPVFTATTDSSHNASFLVKGVKVKVPFPASDIREVDYRVNLKGIWYKANGTSVLGTWTGRYQWYNGAEAPEPILMHNTCTAWDNGGGI